MNSSVRRVVRYFTDLGFYPGQIEFGAGLVWRRLIWSLSAYCLLLLGLLAQQSIDLSSRPIRLSTQNLQISVIVASAIVAVALFRPFMHWFNRKRQQPSWEHVLWAFSFGFFINLSSNLIWKKLF
jgi:hypothetical protein